MEHQTATATKTTDATQAERAAASPPAAACEAEHPLLHLHGRFGNRAVGRLLQAKLKVSQPGDAFEQEADQVADHVLRMPEPGIQRACAACASAEAACPTCDDQRPALLQRQADAVAEMGATGGVHEPVDGPSLGTGQALDATTRGFFEPRFGYDFSQVRVHTDAAANASASGVNALAYTLGRDLVFGAGQYAPETAAGRRLLAHELTHVVQQSRPGHESQEQMQPRFTHVPESLMQRQPAAPRRVEATITVRWIDDDVEFYHRMIGAIAASPNYSGVREASLWQPFHDPIFSLYRRLGLHTPALKNNQSLRLRASAWFDPTAFHGQVTNAAVSTEQEAQLQATTITGVLTPQDNFSGRSNTRVGVAEVVDLSFTASPAVTAASLGGLKWFRASGNGTLTGGNDGRGTFTADATPDRVRLELRVATGLSAGTVVATNNLRVVAPDDALMQKDSRAVKHTHNTWSVGFCGESFLRPKDVSFSRIEFREGATTATASGYLASSNNKAHPVGDWDGVGRGNSTTGCKLVPIDSVYSGDRDPPYSTGDFLWVIPWQYRVGTGPATTFTHARQHHTADAAGTATIEKKGAGPFSKTPGEATVDYDCY